MEKYFSVFQISRDDPTIQRDAFFYGKGDIFPPERAKALFLAGTYKKVAAVNAVNLEHVFELLNLWPDNEADYIARHGRLHSLSVGDIVVNERTGGVWIVASLGFDHLLDKEPANV